MVLPGGDASAAATPLLQVHTVLMFLIPGVTTETLDMRFAWPAAYGDLVAALLAFAALGALYIHRVGGIVAVWIFNIWGLVDLLNAVARGFLFTPDGALGAAFWIPALIVPLLLVTHFYMLRASAWRDADYTGNPRAVARLSMESVAAIG